MNHMGDETVEEATKKVASKPAYTVERNGLIRHMIAILAVSSIVLANMSRQVFNQTIPDMTPRPNTSLKRSVNVLPYNGLHHFAFGENYIDPLYGQSFLSDASTTEAPEKSTEDRYDWSPGQIAVLRSTFAWSYAIFMIPAGRLSEVFGAKWVILLCGFGSALCTIAFPFLADQSYWLAVGSRFVLGLCQTGVSPSMYALLHRWMPAAESMLYLPLIKLGLNSGQLLGTQLNAFESWRTAYYVASGICFAWSAMWFLLVSSYPDQHKLISRAELAYIQQEVGDRAQVASAKADKTKPEHSELQLWRRLLTNRMVLTFMAMKITLKFSSEVQSQILPEYFSHVLKIDRYANKNLMSLNFAIQIEFTLVAIYLTKLAADSKPFGLGNTAMRRIFQGACNFGMAFAFLILLVDMTSYPVACVSMIILALANTLCAGGDALVPVDLSGQYSASIMAIGNSFANVSGFVVSPLMLLLIGEGQNWTLAWIVVAVICGLGGLVFVIFIKAQVQPFDPKYNTARKLGKGTGVVDIPMVSLTAIKPLK